MKTFAAKENGAAPSARKARPYTHQPQGPVRLAQHSVMRKILRAEEVQDMPIAREHRIQRAEDEEPEEEFQRQHEGEEEEPIQEKCVQREAKNEETQFQPKRIQRQVADSRGIRPSRFRYVGPEAKAQQGEIHRILHASGTQAKLTIGQPNDKYEQEADRVTAQVMTMSDTKLQRQPEGKEEEEMLQTKPLSEQITPLVQRQVEPPEEEKEPVQAKFRDRETLQRMCPECEEEKAQRQLTHNEEEEEAVQAKSMPGATPTVTPKMESRINSLKGGGQTLEPSTRAFFEPRFGHELSQVRVHSGARASETAHALSAQAFTLGRDVVYGAGTYEPETVKGKRLIGHELTHVVQQRGIPLPRAKPQARREAIQSGTSLKPDAEIKAGSEAAQSAAVQGNPQKVGLSFLYSAPEGKRLLAHELTHASQHRQTGRLRIQRWYWSDIHKKRELRRGSIPRTLNYEIMRGKLVAHVPDKRSLDEVAEFIVTLRRNYGIIAKTSKAFTTAKQKLAQRLWWQRLYRISVITKTRLPQQRRLRLQKYRILRSLGRRWAGRRVSMNLNPYLPKDLVTFLQNIERRYFEGRLYQAIVKRGRPAPYQSYAGDPMTFGISPTFWAICHQFVGLMLGGKPWKATPDPLKMYRWRRGRFRRRPEITRFVKRQSLRLPRYVKQLRKVYALNKQQLSGKLANIAILRNYVSTILFNQPYRLIARRNVKIGDIAVFRDPKKPLLRRRKPAEPKLTAANLTAKDLDSTIEWTFIHSGLVMRVSHGQIELFEKIAPRQPLATRLVSRLLSRECRGCRVYFFRP